MATIHLSKEGFLRKVVNYETHPNEWNFLGNRPAFIDFYATWCGPCQRLSPIVDEMAHEYAGKIDIYKINVDDEPDLADHFGIRTIPTLLFIPKTGEPHKVIGGVTREELKKALNQLLSSR